MVTYHINRTLGEFKNRVELWLAGTQPRQQPNSSWVYPPPPGEALEAAGLGLVEEYITRRQKTVTYYIAIRAILEICIGIDRITR